jgi:ABC-type transporter MlaC component
MIRRRVSQVLAGVVFLLSVAMGHSAATSEPGRTAEDPAIQFVQRMTRELIAANRSGSDTVFADTLRRNAHVSAIGTYALGSFRGQLSQTNRDSYLNGMVRFISRYAASESTKYQVSHVHITGPSRRVSTGVMVDTKVHLRDGAAYDVQWLLQPAGNGYRVRDAKVQVLLGDYWMTPFLKDLFEKYIAENGSVQALVLALNR